VDNVKNESGTSENKFLFADRILLEVFNENIVLPDGLHGISFKRLWLGTRSRTIKLDSCYIYAKPNDTAGNEFNVFIDSLRIKNLDFNALVKENTIRFDSALCINPAINFNLILKGKDKKNQFTNKLTIDKDSVDQKLRQMLGNLDIGYLTVKNAKVNISTKKDNKTNVYNTENSNFSFGGLKVKKDSDVPLKLGFLDFNVHNYTGYSPDSLHTVKFDDVILRENKIQLNNFRIKPSQSNHDLAVKEIKMQTFELDDIDWMALLYENRIVAGHASLIKPEVHIVSPEPRKDQPVKKKVNPFSILDKIESKVQIGELFIEDGKISFEVMNGPKIALDKCYVGINVKKLLAVEDEVNVIDALDTLSFHQGKFKKTGTDLTLSDGSYSKANRALFFKQIAESKKDRSQSIALNNVKLVGIEISSLNEFSLDELSWGNAKVDMKLEAAAKKNTGKSTLPSESKFTIKKLSGGPTHLSVRNQNIEASTILNRISTGEIVFKNGQKPQISDLFIDGQFLNLNQQDKLKGSLSEFRVVDNKPSSLNNVLVKLPMNGETASIMIPRLTFSIDIHSSLNGNIKADFIELSKPVISFSKQEGQVKDTTQPKKDFAKLPLLQINRITVDQPKVENLPSTISEKMRLNLGSSKWDLLGINSDSNTLKVDSVRFYLSNTYVQTDKFKLNPTEKERIDFKGYAFAFQPANHNHKSKWSLNLNSLKLSGLILNTLHNDSVKQTIALNDLKIENLHINDSSFSKPEAFLNNNAHFRLTNGNIELENGKTNLKVFNLSLTKSTNTLSLDSLTFSPLLDRDAFMKTQEYQATHIQLQSGKINMKGIDFNQLLKDQIISAKKTTINDIHLLVYKDKRLPFHHGITKPMLTDMLLNIKPKILVDSLLLKNGLIEYEEFNNKTQQFGQIKLSNIKGAIAGVRTFDPLPDDSLKFNIYARLLDTADLRLKYKQSYTDSLSGFNLKLIVNSVNLTALNPMLRPFASAELKSGNLDTIRMSVIGRKYIAFGVMKMYYDDLNAVYLNNGDSTNKTAVTKTLSFFANRIVHTKNKKGTGEVYAERDPEKGFVNYWVKIVIGGVLTNAGVRTNKAQERKYEKGLKIHEVPPIPYIPVDY